ncbi:MAG: LysM peptidoglycan-binding domain-containing protein [Marinilabiliaceae bacterium]|nr:LysM peptidoglycan-binding domain-containing protein [Marinilabiliaceae bacterium]
MKRAIERLRRVSNICVVVTFLFPVCLSAQQANDIETEDDENLQMSQCLDSLVSQWHANGGDLSLMVPDSVTVDSLMMVTSLPDSVYQKRLTELMSPIPFLYNETVKRYIELYTIRRRDLVERMLGLSEYYFPMFEEALDASNMPLELKYLPIIESALNTRARSRVGATGLWQFMYGTGKMYGLEVNSYLDERMHPQKATDAAVRFLRDLYAIYGDWHLALAAYNCGPGNVNKAIRRSGGGKQNFWQIYQYLPRETRNYVPAFIAAAYVMNYYRDHNLMPRPTLLPQTADTIMVDKPLHFEQVAMVLNCSMDMIRELNPQYRADVVPAIKKSYPLCLPLEHSLAFASLEDSIFNVNREKYFASDKLLATPVTGDVAPDAPFNSVKITHKVRSGETPGHIAEKYRISLSSLRRWNHLNSRMLIRAGQRLTIYVPKEHSSLYVKSETNSSSSTANVSSSPVTTTDGEYIYYTVKNGDNLWTIAQKFPGVSNTDIMQLNNITDSRRLAVGQRLKIKPKS